MNSEVVRRRFLSSAGPATMNEILWNDVPEDAWNTPVRGYNLRGATLGEELAQEGCLLVFLRHFG